MRAQFALAITVAVLAAFLVFTLQLAGVGAPQPPALYGYGLEPVAGSAHGVPDLMAALNAFFFALAASLLFWGYGALPAAFYETARYGSIVLTGQVHWYALAYAAPQLLAIYAGTLLAAAAADGKVEPRVFKQALLFACLGMLLTLMLYFGRPFVLVQ